VWVQHPVAHELTIFILKVSGHIGGIGVGYINEIVEDSTSAKLLCADKSPRGQWSFAKFHCSGVASPKILGFCFYLIIFTSMAFLSSVHKNGEATFRKTQHGCERQHYKLYSRFSITMYYPNPSKQQRKGLASGKKAFVNILTFFILFLAVFDFEIQVFPYCVQ